MLSKIARFPLTLLFASFAMSQLSTSAIAEVPMTAGAQLAQIHEDLFFAYKSAGRNAEAESELKWLLQSKPTDAAHHYAYYQLLSHSGRAGQALAEIKKAAQFDGGNVDYVGIAGQMMLSAKDYNNAYQYLYRACSMPGGEKFKASLENAIQCKQYADQQKAVQQQKKQAASGNVKKTSKPGDDDDD